MQHSFTCRARRSCLGLRSLLTCLPNLELTDSKISRCNYSRDLATTKSGDEEYVQTGEIFHVVSEVDEQNG